MEIIGGLKSRVEYIFKTSIELSILNANVMFKKIKEEYMFSTMTDTKDNRILLESGKYAKDGKEILITQLMFSSKNDSIGALVLGTSDDCKIVLDAVCDIIDSFKYFEKISDLEKNVAYITSGTVKLNVSPVAFFDPKLLEVMQETGITLKNDLYDIEIQPTGLSISIFLKPDLAKLSKMSLDSSKLAEIFNFSGPRMVQLFIENVDNYEKQRFGFSMDFDSDQAKKTLEQIDKQFAK